MDALACQREVLIEWRRAHGRRAAPEFPIRAMIRPSGLLLSILLLAPAAGLLATADAAPQAPLADAAAVPDRAAAELFEKGVRPVLVEHCFRCHGPAVKAPMGGLRVDSRAALLKGGAAGPAVVPGDVDASLLLRAVRYSDPHLKMPPAGKLPDTAIAALERWIAAGAPWPAQGMKNEGAPTGVRMDGTMKGNAPTHPSSLVPHPSKHWAFQPLHRPALPPIRNSQSAIRNPVDAFILARLEAKGLRPAPPADRRTLLRRVTFDLIGLPPTPEEVEAFVRDRSPRAYEKVVDRLMASPHYGERWARHWLDLVRYAETRGHEYDPPIPNAWQYRDYLIRALNADVPYPQLVTEHLAGDLLPTPRRRADGANESILGTGFWFLGEEVHSPVDIRQDETDRLDNRIDVMGKTFLGLTVGCARCHDHKFDPISQKDYYGLAGFLLSSGYRQARFETDLRERRAAERLRELARKEGPPLLQRAATALQPAVGRSAAYLAASAEALEAGAPGACATLAASRGLDGAVLEAWTAEMRKATSDPQHPLHAFARASFGAPADLPARFAALRQEWRRCSAAPEPRPEQVLVDYSREGVPWYADGFAFGPGPARAGEIVLSGDPAAPIARIVPRGEARSEPCWSEVSAEGVDRDYGKLGEFNRAGRALRTPTVTLGSGMLRYLVRGPGRAYACVDSHLLISGPLHGKLLLEWKGEPDRWQWVTHDLRSYRGHRVHVELTPAAAAGLSVAKVIESEADPGPAGSPGAALLEALTADVTDLHGLASAYQALFTRALDSGSSGVPPAGEEAAALAEIAGWMLACPTLFPIGEEDRRALAAAAGPVMAERSRLLAEVGSASHTAPAMWEGSGVDERVLRRGSYKTPAEPAPRRLLEVLAGPRQPPIREGSGRLELARRIVAHPLTARVMVNRLWQHHFGEGLVRTPDDFGLRGERPTHPELLEWLASELIRHGSLKRMHRLMALSAAYRMSSRAEPSAEAKDPQNRLLHRMPRRRVEAEGVRDAILAVSGRLDPTLYGPSVMPYLSELIQGRGKPKQGPLDGAGRRSIYLSVRRNFLVPFFQAFDYPTPFTTIGRRNVSTVPAQALALLNNPFVVEQAEFWGRRIAGESGTDAERVERLYVTAFARPPTPGELRAALGFVTRERRAHPPGEGYRAWADLCHVLLNTKEFIFVN